MPRKPQWVTSAAIAGVVAFVALAIAPLGSAPAPAYAGPPENAVLDWNLHAVTALTNPTTEPIPAPVPPILLGAGQTPPVAEMHLAMVQGAVYDAVNAIDGGHVPFLVGFPSASSTASTAAAVATAAHDVLVGLAIPGGTQLVLSAATRAWLDGEYEASLAGIPDGEDKVAGIAVGAEAAREMLRLRADDGRFGPFRFTVGTETGQWRPTSPPANDPFAWVARVEPFVIESPSQFRTKGPNAVESLAYAEEYDEVKAFGGNGTTTPSLRTPEQTALAGFYTVNPVELFNRTFRKIAEDQGLTLVEEARLFAMLNIVGADSFITCWDDKAFWNFWRPITAIRLGESDGNPETDGDPGWTSFIGAPPYPEHPSGYNCIVGAYMHTAKVFFGTDTMAFSVERIAPGVPNVTRHYQSFTDVAQDTIDARPKSSSDPPAMIDSVPSRAPTSPPLTGAST
jgi:hypothetical protein